MLSGHPASPRRRENSIAGFLEDLKDIIAAGMLVDEAHQGMIIP
jgi:hypothetical protein